MGCSARFSRHGLPYPSWPNSLFFPPVCSGNVLLKAALCSCKSQEFLHGTTGGPGSKAWSSWRKPQIVPKWPPSTTGPSDNNKKRTQKLHKRIHQLLFFFPHFFLARQDWNPGKTDYRYNHLCVPTLHKYIKICILCDIKIKNLLSLSIYISRVRAKEREI